MGYYKVSTMGEMSLLAIITREHNIIVTKKTQNKMLHVILIPLEAESWLRFLKK